MEQEGVSVRVFNHGLAEGDCPLGEGTGVGVMTESYDDCRFVVYYEHKKKGHDQYFVTDGLTAWNLDAAKQFATREQAEAIVQKYPVLGSGYETAVVMPIRCATQEEIRAI